MITAELTSERDAAWFEELAGAVERGRTRLLSLQQPDGHWCGEVESAGLEADLILLLAFLGKGDDPRVRLAANELLAREPRAPEDVSAAVKRYLALKVAGHAAEEPLMRRAAEYVRALGGAEAADTPTLFWLAVLGQIPYSACPAVPVERMLLPRWTRLGVGEVAAWERPARVALGVIDAFKPVTRLPESMHVGELFLAPPRDSGGLFKKLERRGVTPLRRRAVRKAVNWVRARYADSDGLGAGFTSLAWNAAALKCLGVPDGDPEARWVLAEIDALCVREGETLRVLPYRAAVSDTAASLTALAEAGLAGTSLECDSAVRWLLAREVRRAGDWSENVRGAEPGGWSFAGRNAFYPCVESTAGALCALARSGNAMRGACAGAVHRAINWLLAMQNPDGGWSRFDRGVKADPSCPGVTGRVLEALGPFGFRVGQPPVSAAVNLLLSHQSECGAWGDSFRLTRHVLAGLQAAGFDVALPVGRRAVRWLKESQNEDCGWGEGISTASETAWAVLGLMGAREGDSPEVRAGAEFLVGTQRADGAWAGAARRGALDTLPLAALGQYRQAVLAECTTGSGEFRVGPSRPSGPTPHAATQAPPKAA